MSDSTRSNITENGTIQRIMLNGKERVMTAYEATVAFEELIDKALNELSPNAFGQFLDNVSMILDDLDDE